MKDSRGQELAVGDSVVYAGRGGSSCWVRCATITHITSKPSKWDTAKMHHTLQVEVSEPKQTWQLAAGEKPSFRTYKTHTSVMEHLVKVTGIPQ